MAEDFLELLFFDTFSHEINEDLNLDLVQFPKPVYVREVRIIPLGAKVQADFPGGVRLGATNPSRFHIEFFVNDLGKPGASTFECLGNLEYNQNDCIHLECQNGKIPTDGLVLRGCYTTITLAVYGTHTKHLSEQIASPPPPIETVPDDIEISSAKITSSQNTAKDDAPWPNTTCPIPPESNIIFQPDTFPDPAIETLEKKQFTDDCYYQGTIQDTNKDREKLISPRKSCSSERSISRNRTYSLSDSNDREYSTRPKRDWSRSPEYRHSRRVRVDRSREVVEQNDRENKRPRTPPLQELNSCRPPSPEDIQFVEAGDSKTGNYRQKSSKLPAQVVKSTEFVSNDNQPTTTVIEDDIPPPSEPFEPILSDEDIGDDVEEQINEDIEMEDNYFEDSIKIFNPFINEINRFELDVAASSNRDIELINKTIEKFEIQTKSNFKHEFLQSSSDEKENFIFISEQLLLQLQQTCLTSFKRRNYVLNKIFEEQENNVKLCSAALNIALDFECACSQPQPGFKIRHIKIGVRMAELLGASDFLFKYFVDSEGGDPFKSFFDLYDQDYMALSIKLMILRAIYATFDSKHCVNLFSQNKLNGYNRLLSLLNRNPPTRVKYAIKSIIKKINLFECLENVQKILMSQFVCEKVNIDNSINNLEYFLVEIKKSLTTDASCYQQPRRFLPVSEKFEIIKDTSAIKCYSHMVKSFFKIHSFAECLLLIITNHTKISTRVIGQSLEIIQILVRTTFGLEYFIEDCFETTKVLIKSLLGFDEESIAQIVPEPKTIDLDIRESVEKVIEKSLNCAQKLGVEVAFRIQTQYHVDVIKYTKDNADALVEDLHALYSQTCNNPGRMYTADVIGMNNNIIPFLNLIEKERKIQTQQESPGVKLKSPVLSYAVDIVDCCVRYCTNLEYLKDQGTVLLDLVKNHEIFEPSVSAVLQEMAVYLKPLEVINNFNIDDIPQIADVIKKSVEFITTFPGDLIMGLRILRHFAISNNQDTTKELKYRYIILQFYSTDGIMILLSVLEKLNNYFEQPGLHSAILMTTQAVHACQILHPTLEILREMLTFVIQCRDTHFKDVTAVEHLMKTYALMHFYPKMSAAYVDSQKIKTEIVNMLLAYTQPNPEDQESVYKSLWTQMIKEVIKFTLTSPSTFIPGLQAFAELLPLPLPVLSSHTLTEAEMQRLTTDRKLWSAHLHPLSGQLSELIQKMCPSTFPQLKDLLIRVCLQLADLAPNMTLVVSKAVIDLILDEGLSSSGVGTTTLSRLLSFLGQLTIYASVKTSSLSIFSGRLYELFNQILSKKDQSEVHIQCQLNVHRILENFFDSEISMIAPNSTGNLELNLACTLPSRELISGIASSILENLFNSSADSGVVIAASRNLIILTEHDITFYYLRNALEIKKEQFQEWLNNLTEMHNKSWNQALMGNIILFVRALIVIDDPSVDTTLPSRALKLNIQEFSALIGWDIKNDGSHALNKIKDIACKDEVENTTLLRDTVHLLNFLESPTRTKADEKVEFLEPSLPQAEGIVTQYLSRPIFTLYEPLEETQLSANFWLEPIMIENLQQDINIQSGMVSCDLTEIVKLCLSSEINLTSDCKRLLHLSASPQSSRERKATAPCFRTRRVEVEPSTGRPEKKVFITPMRGRGFPRTPPSRGDLFRSRPPNTSRPPSLHVDDFLALETCGAQPTGPTGYNKLSRDIISIRGSRGNRSRGNRISTIAASGSYRTNSPNWSHMSVDTNGSPSTIQHFRIATSEPVVTSQFVTDSHYGQPHFGGPIRSRGRGRARTFLR